MTKNIYNVDDIFEDIPGDPDNVLLKFPPELLTQLAWVEGDTISVTLENGSLIIKKINT